MLNHRRRGRRWIPHSSRLFQARQSGAVNMPCANGQGSLTAKGEGGAPAPWKEEVRGVPAGTLGGGQSPVRAQLPLASPWAAQPAPRCHGPVVTPSRDSPNPGLPRRWPRAWAHICALSASPRGPGPQASWTQASRQGSAHLPGLRDPCGVRLADLKRTRRELQVWTLPEGRLCPAGPGGRLTWTMGGICTNALLSVATRAQIWPRQAQGPGSGCKPASRPMPPEAT